MRARAGGRRAAAVAALCVLAGGLVACAGGESGDPSGAASGELPSKSELAAWADGAISENQTGGATYLVREEGTLPQGDHLNVDISALTGSGTLSIACLAPSEGVLGLSVIVEGDMGTGREVACATADDPGGGNLLTVTVQPSDDVALVANHKTAFVYSVTPVDQPQS